MVTKRISHPVYHRPNLTGRPLYTDLATVRYEVLAVSANGAVALLRRQVKVDDVWRSDNTLATVPVHHISPDSDYVETGPWLALFAGLQAVRS